MEPIERRLRFYDLHMVCRDTAQVPAYPLPAGYAFVFFRAGDEADWARIEQSAGEFVCFEEGLARFRQSLGQDMHELERRCLFIENDRHEKVATATAFFIPPDENGITGKMHWVAVKKEAQGKGLARPLIAETLRTLCRLGHKKAVLHTQTHTWLAVRLYLDFGLEPYRPQEEAAGWSIIRTLTDHPKLQAFPALPQEELFDGQACAVYAALKAAFPAMETYRLNEQDDTVTVRTGEKICTCRIKDLLQTKKGNV